MELTFTEVVVGQINDSIKTIETALDEIRYEGNLKPLDEITLQLIQLRQLINTGVLDGK